MGKFYRVGQAVGKAWEYVHGSRSRDKIKSLEEDSRAKDREIDGLETAVAEIGSHNISLAGEVLSAGQTIYVLQGQAEEREAEMVSQERKYDQDTGLLRDKAEERGNLVKQLQGALRNLREEYGESFAKSYMQVHSGDFALFANSRDQVIEMTKSASRALGLDPKDNSREDIYSLIEPFVDHPRKLRTKLKNGNRADACSCSIDFEFY